MKTLMKVMAAILVLTMLISATAFADDMENVVEQAVVETPAPEAPKAEEPKLEAPKAEEPKPEAPAAEPEAPVTEPEAPAAEPEAPAAEPEAPATEPEAPATEPEVPATEPEAPATEPEVPATEPEAPVTENTEATEEVVEEIVEEEVTEEIVEEAPIARSVRLVSDRDLNSLTEGDVVTLTVILEGFDNAQYTIDWQTAKGSDWTSIEGAHGTTYTFTADADCEGRSWQAAIEVIG